MILKIKQLKLAESIRVKQSEEDKFLDFTSRKYADYDCYYSEGLVYIKHKQTGEIQCTSLANIRQMAIDELYNGAGLDGIIKASKSTAASKSKVAKVPSPE